MLKVPFCHLGNHIYMPRAGDAAGGAANNSAIRVDSRVASWNLMLSRFNEDIWARGRLHLSPKPDDEGRPQALL